MKLRILVEGVDDDHVVRHLLAKHGIPAGIGTDVEIKNMQGFSNLRKSFSVELRASDITHLAVITDIDIAEEDDDRLPRWQSVRDVLRSGGYDMADEGDPDGTIAQRGAGLTVGVWLMPENRASGVLEDFVAQLIPVDDVLWPRAQSCVDGIPLEARPFRERDLPKARIHTWLAWQKEPGLKMGSAISRAYLAHDGVAATAFISWLHRLISTP